ncbi:DUF3347 domain-containing protein [Gelidibacter sp. F2691]|nr:DUF3347 domain-containing protein [Gelidibacter sp. F2691]
MKTIKRSIGSVALAATLMLTVSCKDASKTEATTTSESTTENTVASQESVATSDKQDAKAEVILKDYFNLKDALVGDDAAKAKEFGTTLTTSLKAFEASNYSETEQSQLKSILEEATAQAEQIVATDLKEQRTHFKVLSKNITDMVAITGTEMTLYEQFCPMYDRGSAWLSTKAEIRNPYHGSSMLKCGSVQREIN